MHVVDQAQVVCHEYGMALLQTPWCPARILKLAAGAAADALDPSALASLQFAVESGVSSGFQLAAAAGPLCDEPLWGIAFEVHLWPSLQPTASSE